jgi:hypothetical protein
MDGRHLDADRRRYDRTRASVTGDLVKYFTAQPID